MDSAMITFIIPTIGRDTLPRAIDSVMEQTTANSNIWKIIIIFDGMEPNLKGDKYINHPQIMIKSCPKMGTGLNSAGLVRNWGMQYVETEWTAFLDDDDVIGPNYIERFMEEMKEMNGDLDVLIFRMKLGERIVPSLTTNNFFLCDVGISFILKSNLFLERGFVFQADGAEDYLYLNKLRENNCKIVISPYIQYFVKDAKIDNNGGVEGNRVYINYKNHIFTFLSYMALFDIFNE